MGGEEVWEGVWVSLGKCVRCGGGEERGMG